VIRHLVDTGPLVGLCDPDDQHHLRATKEIDLLHGSLCVGLPVLTEAHFLLKAPHRRKRLMSFIQRGLFQLALPKQPDSIALTSLIWLERYAEHDPDFSDGHLVCWAERERDVAIWTFDQEFRTTWRTLRGKRVRLSVP
jgi:predicted nucleic acid-binding protein